MNVVTSILDVPGSISFQLQVHKKLTVVLKGTKGADGRVIELRTPGAELSVA